MIVNFVYNDILKTLILPEKISGQFWLCSPDNRRMLLIEAQDDIWKMNVIAGYSVRSMNSGDTNCAELPDDKGLYQIKNINNPDERIYVFTERHTDDRAEYHHYSIPEKCLLTLGNGKSPVTVSYENDYVSANHAVMNFADGKWTVSDSGSRNGTFVNGRRVTETVLRYGDIIFIAGLKIIAGNGWIAFNNPDGKVNFSSEILKPIKFELIPDDDDSVNVDTEDKATEYFDRSPRFKRSIEPVAISVDSPPNEEGQDETPAVLTTGPAVTMAMASMTSGAFAVSNAISNNNIKSAVPTLVMSCSMCLGTLLWPALSRRYSKKQKAVKENRRRIKYNEYLDRKRIEIRKICEQQSDILRENNITSDECADRIMNVQRNLWERSNGQDDFLTFRAGFGDLPMYGSVEYTGRRFSVNDDILENSMLDMCEEPKILQDVPVSVSLLEKSLGIIGSKNDIFRFVKGMVIQLSALYSYDEVKLVFLYDKTDQEQFEYAKWLPHTWNDEENLRMIASDQDEIKPVAAHIERVFSYREDEINDSDLEDETPYYIVIALSKKQFDRAEVLRKVLASKKKVHMSVVSAFTELRMLPKECSSVIELNGDKGRIFDRNDTSGGALEFTLDNDTSRSCLDLSVKLANIKLDVSNQSSRLPKMVTFLQMMEAGKVEHLNSLLRWKENDPTKSLAVPVGVNPYGDLFMLDLHEKYHGPHGLVAGMTGSGKSEFVISYILSLAVNFHPEEVSFILIDYKGGGMAKSFENLPHTAGIITNLDGSAMKRSLVSINSELKRRQAILTEAGKIVGESNMNIYQYQKLYREHAVKEPLSHLFIIADEFAELKTQQPEFMTELISAARIGRSLGVHLILATQKPSGVVDDQIWSNSRFRVCLKVQEKQDSMDMLKRPDAAELSDTGRFYLQVGYNELFESGQSAWAGAEYYPSDHALIEKDNSVDAIDLNGQVVLSAKPKPSRQIFGKPGKQLDKITSYLADIAANEGTNAKQLWLEPMPEVITLDELMVKYPEEYAESRRSFLLNPVIGEYDNPAGQKQSLLTVPLTDEGNLIIYGTAGSGKSTLLNTMIYSLITEHTPDEVNLYILDFADETLNAFSAAPHVGDVMLSHDGEKITRLFRMLYHEIRKRKKKLSVTGLDYVSYTAKYTEQSDMPAYLIVISNFSAFTELYPDSEDDIVFLSREGRKYGIYFVISSLTTNGVRFRIAQNFRQHLVLQQNDDGDYSSVLGKTDGLFPAKIKGRGLIKTDSIYEFQTAYISKEVTSFEAAKEKCSNISEYWNGRTAEKIPVLPDVVDADFVSAYINKKQPFVIPVGVNKNTLKVQKYNFEKHCINMLLSADTSYLGFTAEFINTALRVPELKIIVFDAASKLGSDIKSIQNDKIKIYSGPSECSEGVMWMFDEMVRRNNTYKQAIADKTEIPQFEYTMCIIVSVKMLNDSLDGDIPERLKLVLEKNEQPYRFSVLAADEAREVSSYSFAPWYKKHVAGNEGIWYGNGVSEQYSIRANRSTSEMRQPIAAPLGYIFENGEAALCKLLSEGSEIDDE